eukprot:scaffold61034_cov31-Tisochrysis_lutea.AAC.1
MAAVTRLLRDGTPPHRASCRLLEASCGEVAIVLLGVAVLDPAGRLMPRRDLAIVRARPKCKVLRAPGSPRQTTQVRRKAQPAARRARGGRRPEVRWGTRTDSGRIQDIRTVEYIRRDFIPGATTSSIPLTRPSTRVRARDRIVIVIVRVSSEQNKNKEKESPKNRTTTNI